MRQSISFISTKWKSNSNKQLGSNKNVVWYSHMGILYFIIKCSCYYQVFVITYLGSSSPVLIQPGLFSCHESIQQFLFTVTTSLVEVQHTTIGSQGMWDTMRALRGVEEYAEVGMAFYFMISNLDVEWMWKNKFTYCKTYHMKFNATKNKQTTF